MPTFSEADIMALVSPVFWPFLRILAVFSSAHIFSARSVPMRTRVALAMLIALCAQAVLPEQPVIGLTDPDAFAVVLQQVVVGVAIGLAVRIVFASVELAGEVIGLQMRLHELGAVVFRYGLWIALPMIGLLLFINIVLGFVSRIAPQMNAFAIGFPLTITAGLIGISATLPMLDGPVVALLKLATDIFTGG